MATTLAPQPQQPQGASGHGQQQAGQSAINPPASPPQDASAAQSDANKAAERDRAERSVAAAEQSADWTVVAVFVGIVLGLLQLGLLVASLSISLVATDAADRAARAAEESNTTLERGRLAVFVDHSNAEQFFGGSRPASDRPFPWQIKFSVVNYGRSIAYLNWGKFGLTGVAKDPGTRPEIGDAGGVTRMPVPPGSERPHEQVTEPFPIPPDLFDQIWAGELLIVFHGTIEYEDVFGNTHTHHFAWQWSVKEPGKGGSRYSGGPREWIGDTTKTAPSVVKRGAARWLEILSDRVHRRKHPAS